MPAFHETVTAAEPNTLIEYKITKGSPLRGHWGKQVLTPTADGGTLLDYTIGFDVAPGLSGLVGKVLANNISKGLPKTHCLSQSQVGLVGWLVGADDRT